MYRSALPLILLGLAAASPGIAGDSPIVRSEQGQVEIHPVEHATFVLESGDQRIALDPVGGGEQGDAFAGVDLALVTDIHGDHFDARTLQMLAAQGASIVAPSAVVERMDRELSRNAIVLENGETTTIGGVTIEAIPMYNMSGSPRHPKGRGNGYVLEVSGLRIYVSGDTEDIPEMRGLQDIDVAIVCMNLPYTMDVESAAEAVLDMQPRIVYPYHYRGQDGFSDIGRFAQLVQSENSGIEVRQLEWYPR